MKENKNKKIKDLPYLMYWHANNLFGSTMLQKLPVSRLKRIIKNINKFDKDLIKKYDKNRITRYLVEVDLNYPE